MSVFLQISTGSSLVLNEPKTFLSDVLRRRAPRQGQRQTRPQALSVRTYMYVRTDVTSKFSRLDGFTNFYSYGCSAHRALLKMIDLS